MPFEVFNLRTALFIQRDPGRFSTALLIALLCHALLLSITLGGQKFGLPGLDFLWKKQGAEPTELRILLAPAEPVAAPPPPETAPPEIADKVSTPVVQPKAAPDSSSLTMRSEVPQIPAATPAPSPAPAMPAAKRPDVNLPMAPDAPPVRARAEAETRNIPAPASEVPAVADATQKQLEQNAREQALEQARLEQEKQSAERLRQAELKAEAAKSAAARKEAERQELARQEILRREALQQERTRQDDKARQEAARQELERTEAARLDAARKEATRQEQAKVAQREAARQAQNQLEAAQQEATRQEAARQDSAKQEAARQERARQEQARQDALKQESARQEAARQETARQDAAKQDAARQEQAKLDQAQREKAEQEAKREERLRAIGKQLNQEAAQREAASNGPSRSLLPGISGLRRGRLLGRADPDADLVLYAEAMGRKIELNMTFDMVREAVKQPHAQPLVTVAVRADGSVEKVTFVVASGVPAIDDAIRKVVASQAPYAAFPPNLARQYDVIEIRRTWIFDTAIRLQ